MHYRDLHTFAVPHLLRLALTHPSYANEHPGEESNQRLEFLGDSVLQLVVSELLLARFPEWDEGRLTKARARLVDRRQCAMLAVALELHRDLRTDSALGAGVDPQSKVLADVFEAIVAAIYLDAGLPGAREALTRLLTPLLGDLALAPLTDVKSRLLEWCQARKLPPPAYEELARRGPAHALVFGVTVSVGGTVYGPSVGSSKKTAQLGAAALALASLEGDAG